MAKAKLNPILEELHGKMGELVFRRTRNGGISLIRKADMFRVNGALPRWQTVSVSVRQLLRPASH